MRLIGCVVLGMQCLAAAPTPAYLFAYFTGNGTALAVPAGVAERLRMTDAR